jgi:hypothetical protein
MYAPPHGLPGLGLGPFDERIELVFFRKIRVRLPLAVLHLDAEDTADGVVRDRRESLLGHSKPAKVPDKPGIESQAGDSGREAFEFLLQCVRGVVRLYPVYGSVQKALEHSLRHRFGP